ncbi:hypothetical protein HMI54_004586 [Coelomomyces lativittatus]|nr:hypothetical protein HMI56_002937 [Coelomomyces lativittatus]KAJ1507003.1 hypothetical protein HMI54_004586 [Coelomomyces lativittatus]KAJ1509766.1 hypothetical protein HMI55_007266 [Coelomomyces lativittatus]
MNAPPLKTLRRNAATTAKVFGKHGFGVIARFRHFIIRGNVLDIAVGMIIAAAVTSVLESFVKDIFTPILSLIGGRDSLTLAEMHWVMSSPSGRKEYSTREEAIKDKAITLDYGAFLQELLRFLIASLALFLLIQLIQPLFQENEIPKMDCPYCLEKVPETAMKCRSCCSALIPSAPQLMNDSDETMMHS